MGGKARFTYRVRLSATAQQALLAEWDRCRWVWNQCVSESRDAYRAGRACGPAWLDKRLTRWREEHDWLGAGSTVPQQQTIRDFAKSRSKACKDTKNRVPVRQRAGMPKYRKKRLTLPSLNYTRRGFTLDAQRVRLAGGIVVRPVWSRELPAAPSSVRLFRDSLGHWYCSFVVDAVAEPLPPTGAVIGIDWGVAETATTTSDGHDLPHTQRGKAAAAKLARYQRMMARRKPVKGKPGSNGYKHAKHRAAKLHTKVARQRQDDARKWAKAVTRDFDQIAVEDFKPRFLAKSTMARKAADAAIAATKTALIDMARKHQREVRLVDPKYTTMDCSNCDARTTHRLPLSERTYTCAACGLVKPRDKNSAAVMVARAGFLPAGVDRVRPDGPPDRQAA
ncbi:MAG: transposase [Rhodococcus sp.]|nr:transposase [Rhodococcus sp. (in: high G+C Gram-positive bacteria)]